MSKYPCNTFKYKKHRPSQPCDFQPTKPVPKGKAFNIKNNTVKDTKAFRTSKPHATKDFWK